MSTFFKFFILALCLTIVSCSNKKSTDPSQDHVPAAPSNLIGEVLSSSSIRLTWADNSSNETRFLIFRSNTGIWSQITTTPQNHTTFTDTNLLEVTSYQYYVVATNNAGNSTASDILSLTTELAAPSNLTGQVISSSSIRKPSESNGSPCSAPGARPASARIQSSFDPAGSVLPSSGTG